MATYDKLAVYKTSYDLLLALFQYSKDFSREYKYTIGAEIKSEVMEMIKFIYKANSSQKDRVMNIAYARESVEMVRLLLRLLKDLQQINTKKFIFLTEKIESVSKQLSAWQKYSANRPESHS